jgi:capsular polysaccharide biosynthesis protein
VEERERSPLPLRSILLRGLPLAVICAAGCAALVGLLSSRREEVYTANALVLMRAAEDPAADPQAIPEAEGQRVATQSLLVARRPVLERVAERIPGVSVGELDGAVSVTQISDTDAIRVTAEAGRPRLAANMANGVAGTFVAMERRSTTRRAREALEVLRKELRRLDSDERDGTEGIALRERIQNLTVLEGVGSVAPRVAERAEPPAEASQPKPRRDALFGGIFGFVLGMGLGVAWVAADRRIRDPGEASEVLGAPALATVPRRRWLPGRRRARERAEEQAWQLLHLGLRPGPDGAPLRTLAVTTLGDRSERSRVAYGLASTAAASGARALLISMDPDREALNGAVDGSGDRLAALLAGEATLPEATSTVELPSNRSGQLDVVAGEVSNGRPAGVIESSRLSDAVKNAAAAYELVVIDTPSVLEHVEGLPVVSEADGTLVVLPAHPDREQLVALRGRLDALRAHVVGVVIGRT